MKLRIGIIGCGGIATGKHLSALKSNGDLCEVVAFCDGILDRAKKAGTGVWSRKCTGLPEL